MADILYNDQSDPFNSDAEHYLHVETTGYSGTYADLICPAAANYPPEAPTRYFIYTNWIINQSDLAGSRPIAIKDVDTTTTLSPTSSAPGANEYRISPSPVKNRNIIELHSGQAGHTIACDLYKEGDVFVSAKYNDIANSGSITSGSTMNATTAIVAGTTIRATTGYYTRKYDMTLGDEASPVNILPVIFTIGDWDMDTTASLTINVPFLGIGDGTVEKKIISIDVIIRNDDETVMPTPLFSSLDGTINGYFSFSRASAWVLRITMTRVAGKLFDDANYNSTSYNRGFITVWYEV